MVNVASRRLVHSTLGLEWLNVDEWELDIIAVFGHEQMDRTVEAPHFYYCGPSVWWEFPIPVFIESWLAEVAFL